jgi:hypothetical protein
MSEAMRKVCAVARIVYVFPGDMVNERSFRTRVCGRERECLRVFHDGPECALERREHRAIQRERLGSSCQIRKGFTGRNRGGY